MRFQTFLFAVVGTFFFSICTGARIVVIYAVSSKSHMFAVMPVIEKLGEKGHQITVFSPHRGMAKKVPNGHEIILTEFANKTQIDWFAMQKEGPIQMFSILKAALTKSCNEILTHPEFRKIVMKRNVDLFIVDGFFHEFLYPVFDLIGVPFVTHSASTPLPAVLAAMGAPIDYAFVPTAITDFDDHMTFFQRLTNMISNEIFSFIRTYYLMKDLDSLVKTHYTGARPIAELEGQASIYIINCHPMTNWPRSLPPTIVPLGALHTRPAKPLPEGLKEFADEAEEGLVVFTLGSVVPVSSMPKETVDTFIRVFSNLPQRIVWKWEADILPQNISSNIMMVKWLPQQDLLGHPNTKVFISHGGMLGTQEATYHGVPILGLPFGNDQRGNIAKVKRGGWGLHLDWDQIDDRSLNDALIHLIHNPYVRANASRVSRVMHDQILPGKDVAVYWIEFVMRHGGTKHLQLASKNMPFYQRHLLDVALFAAVILVAITVSSYYTIRFVVSKFLNKRTSLIDSVKHKLH